MSKWQKVKLGDVATYINGCAFKPSDWADSGLPIVRIQNLTGSFREINYFNGKYNPKYEINNGDVLISWSASLGVYIWNNGKAILNQHIFKVVFDKIKIDKNYFMFAVNSLLQKMEKKCHGATMKHITKPLFDNMSFPLPPMEEQKKIAARLDAVSDLLTKQKQFLAEQDNLIQSTFYDMFEPIHLSQKSAAWKKIGKLARVVGGSTPKTSVADYWDGSLNWFTPAELDNNSWYVYSSQRKITTAGVQSCHLEKQPADTVILSSRAPIGKLAIAKQEFYCNQGFKNIICGKQLNSVWLYHLLMYNVDYLQSLGKGATFKEISKTIVEDIKIPVPSIELQQKFAAVAEQIESEKAKIKSAIAETQTLFNALMSEYFEE